MGFISIEMVVIATGMEGMVVIALGRVVMSTHESTDVPFIWGPGLTNCNFFSSLLMRSYR